MIIAAMPTPITAVLLSGKHGGDEQCAAGMLFVSTLLSLVTLPIWCMFYRKAGKAEKKFAGLRLFLLFLSGCLTFGENRNRLIERA